MAISMAGFSFPHGYNLVPTQNKAGPVDFETLVRNLARVRGSKLLALLLQQVPGEREATEQLA